MAKQYKSCDNGANYGAGAASCPQQVLRYNSANTSIRTLTFIGLNVAKTYSFDFFGSRINSDNSTIIKIGSRQDTISTNNNLNDHVQLTNIKPDNTGKIAADIFRIGTWTYLAGFIITEQDASATAVINIIPGNTPEMRAEAGLNNVPVESLMIYPNPTKSTCCIRIPDNFTGNYLLTLTDIYGKQVWQRNGNKGTGACLVQADMNHLEKGMYILQLHSGNNKMKVIMVKL